MLLSIQQKYILEVLRKLGCIRKKQLLLMTQEKFRRPDIEVTETRMDAMLRTGTSSILGENGLICLSSPQSDGLHLEAIDVMLELAEGKPEDFTTRVERPGILRFSWGDDLRLFTVAELSAPIRPTVEALASQKRMIWISESGVPPEGLTLPPRHFFAARQPDGSHRFYGSTGS